MPKVAFARDFPYRVPRKPSTIAYKAGWSGNVPRAHEEAARAAGALKIEESDDNAGGR